MSRRRRARAAPRRGPATRSQRVGNDRKVIIKQRGRVEDSAAMGAPARSGGGGRADCVVQGVEGSTMLVALSSGAHAWLPQPGHPGLISPGSM
ncbi:hypothetical protein DKG34_29625 [Streptomyces sp. NWU49]|uniref:hypothetical protein n=1 Tax=Streptomyces sp. NWU49 TaxID=2201153 RepID=UPI000D677BEE|nr:hypothetical protein [Streptomyces sp. NWU49]PWJ04026.1 hypothetical protein DKG34_29625 [Streptomyces sp. NWU49]